MWTRAESQGDMVWRGEVAVAAGQAVRYSRVVDKNQEGYLGSELSQPQSRPQSLGF